MAQLDERKVVGLHRRLVLLFVPIFTSYMNLAESLPLYMPVFLLVFENLDGKVHPYQLC